MSWPKLDLIYSTYSKLVETNLSLTYCRGATLIYRVRRET